MTPLWTSQKPPSSSGVPLWGGEKPPSEGVPLWGGERPPTNEALLWRRDWTPLEIPTVFWYDAADIGTISSIENQVMRMLDKSGNGYALVPSAAGRGANTGTQTLNGLNVLEYTEGVQVLENITFEHPQPLCIAFVVRLDEDGVSGDQDFIFSGTKSLDTRAAIRRTSFSSWQILCGNSLTTAPNSANEGAEYIACFYFGATSGQTTIRINGTLMNQGTVANNSFTSINIGNNETRNISQGQRLDGALGEVLSFTNPVHQEIVEGYLALKWGLQEKLPASHPYKNLAPSLASSGVPLWNGQQPPPGEVLVWKPVWGPWTPDPATICIGEEFQQIRTHPLSGDEYRASVGTREPTWSAWSPSVLDVEKGVQFEQTRTSDCGHVETQNQTGLGNNAFEITKEKYDAYVRGGVWTLVSNFSGEESAADGRRMVGSGGSVNATGFTSGTSGAVSGSGTATATYNSGSSLSYGVHVRVSYNLSEQGGLYYIELSGWVHEGSSELDYSPCGYPSVNITVEGRTLVGFGSWCPGWRGAVGYMNTFASTLTATFSPS